MKQICTIDIETDCLLEDAVDYSEYPYKLKDSVKFWVVVVTNARTMESAVFKLGEITKENLKSELDKYDIVVTHHGHKFDLLMMKLAGLIDYKVGYIGEQDTLNGKEVRLVDTHVVSRLLDPDRFGGHSLKAYGEELGDNKIDYRQNLIDLGVMDGTEPRGHEFTFYHESMVEYCIQDTVVTAKVFSRLFREISEDKDAWTLALQMEHKLADLAIKREMLGFQFDTDKALYLIEDLTDKMNGIKEEVDPILPKKKMTVGTLNHYTPPKKPIKKDGEFSSHMVRFFERLGIKNYCHVEKVFEFEGQTYHIEEGMPPLKTEEEAVVEDLDVVKHFLLEQGWEPTEWGLRDITKNSKKEALTADKKERAVKRYVKETLEGKYKKERLKELGLKEGDMEQKMMSKAFKDNRYLVPTAPKLRVGVTKELCPNLVKLGNKVSFARAVADFYTYRHRRSSIAGGITDDFEYDVNDKPDTGFISKVRQQDGRIPTPAIECGTNTFRYKHISVANIPRASSIYGKEMRSLFGAGPDFVQFGFDYSSLEARIQGHYIYDYEGGDKMAETLLAEKPNDIHSVTANNLGLERDDAKSINYMVLYGGSWTKVVSMLGYTPTKAKKFLDDWWDSNLPLKQLRDDKVREWISTGKKYIRTIDGRKVRIRSQHSIINALFQSAGAIFAKYVTVKMFEKFENSGYCIDVFEGKPDIASFIEYHDENQLGVNKELLKYKVFKTEEEAKKFVDEWTGNQLSSIQKSDKGIYYVALPSIISDTITETVKEVEEMFGMNVPIGYAYETGRTWADCH